MICGRGKQFTSSPGNLRLAGIVREYLQEYSRVAHDKAAKSQIVSNILRRAKQPQPGRNDVHHDDGIYFVKQGTRTSSCHNRVRYYEVDDSVAREKIGGMLRDRLHSQYKSSSKAKTAKRRLGMAMQQQKLQQRQKQQRQNQWQAQDYPSWDPLLGPNTLDEVPPTSTSFSRPSSSSLFFI